MAPKRKAAAAPEAAAAAGKKAKPGGAGGTGKGGGRPTNAEVLARTAAATSTTMPDRPLDRSTVWPPHSDRCEAAAGVRFHTACPGR